MMTYPVIYIMISRLILYVTRTTINRKVFKRKRNAILWPDTGMGPRLWHLLLMAWLLNQYCSLRAYCQTDSSRVSFHFVDSQHCVVIFINVAFRVNTIYFKEKCPFNIIPSVTFNTNSYFNLKFRGLRNKFTDIRTFLLLLSSFDFIVLTETWISL